jgi:hypothetical protein
MRHLCAIATICLAIACGGSNPIGPQVLPAADLASAPTQATVGGKSLILVAQLWRDFMPISPPDGKPLAGALRIQAVDGSNVPADVAADTAWIIRGAEAWATFVAPAAGRSAGPVYEVTFSDGPKWGPGEAVDVVVRLRDAAGHVALVRAPRQVIGRTD